MTGFIPSTYQSTSSKSSSGLWKVSLLVSWLTFVSGCSQRDFSEYRPVSQTHSSTSESEAMVETADNEVSNPSASKTTSTDDSAALKETAEANQSESSPAASDETALIVSALAPLNVIDGNSISSVLTVVGDSQRVPQSNALSSETGTEVPTADALTAVNQVSFAASESTKSRTVSLLIPEKTFRKEPGSKALRVSYDDLDLLKVLNMEPVTVDAVDQMPEWMKSLNGKMIKIRGFMYPHFETEGIERFVLARDNQICCFGRDPKIYDLIQVDMQAGKTTNYIPATRSFDVVGQLKIQMASDDGKPLGLYYLENATVIDK